jgi:hypothetical protein
MTGHESQEACRQDELWVMSHNNESTPGSDDFCVSVATATSYCDTVTARKGKSRESWDGGVSPAEFEFGGILRLIFATDGDVQGEGAPLL